MKNLKFHNIYMIKLLLFFCFFITIIPTNATTQAANVIIMVNPYYFKYNHQASLTNKFAKKNKPISVELIEKEFYDMVNKLRNNDINVMILDPPLNKDAPDAIFPNNWFSTHKKKDADI